MVSGGVSKLNGQDQKTTSGFYVSLISSSARNGRNLVGMTSHQQSSIFLTLLSSVLSCGVEVYASNQFVVLNLFMSFMSKYVCVLTFIELSSILKVINFATDNNIHLYLDIYKDIYRNKQIKKRACFQ